MSFWSLTKGTTPENLQIVWCVKINKGSFDPFMCLDPVNNKKGPKEF